MRLTEILIAGKCEGSAILALPWRSPVIVAATLEAAAVLGRVGQPFRWLPAPTMDELRWVQGEIDDELSGLFADRGDREEFEAGRNHMVWRLQWWMWRHAQVEALLMRGNVRITVVGHSALDSRWHLVCNHLSRVHPTLALRADR